MTDKQAATHLFWDTFKVDIRKYYNPIFGLDVIKFDDDVVKPNDGLGGRPNKGESTEQAIIRQWGAIGVSITKALF